MNPHNTDPGTDLVLPCFKGPRPEKFLSMEGLWAAVNSLGIAMELSGVITITITSIITDRPVRNLAELLRMDPMRLEESEEKDMTAKQELPLDRMPNTMGEYYAMRNRYLKEAAGALLLFFGLGLQLLSSLYLEGIV